MLEFKAKMHKIRCPWSSAKTPLGELRGLPRPLVYLRAYTIHLRGGSGRGWKGKGEGKGKGGWN